MSGYSYVGVQRIGRAIESTGILQRSASTLDINRPGDRYEQEAEQVAATVMVGGTVTGQMLSSIPGFTPRRYDGLVQRQSTDSSDRMIAPPIVHEVLRSVGTPLDTETQSFMESRFGHDFSKVRVHSDARAIESARAVEANAYTVGTNIVFGRDQPTLATSEGRRLIAHELTHVIQQTHDNSYVTSQKAAVAADSSFYSDNFTISSRGSLGKHILNRDPIGKSTSNNQAPKIKYKYVMTGYKPSTGIGHFDRVEYNSDTQILTFTVRPEFHFPEFNPASYPSEIRTDQKAMAQAKEEYKAQKRAYMDSFNRQIEEWSGKHVFYCHEMYAKNLRATTRFEVEIVKSDENRNSTDSYTPVVTRDDNSRSHSNHGAGVSVPLNQGYKTRYDAKNNKIVYEIIATPLAEEVRIDENHISLDEFGMRRPSKYESIEDPSEQLTFKHEIGHIFGLGDEYTEDTNPLYAPGKPTEHTQLAKSMLGKDVTHKKSTQSVMSTGNKILPEHGVTFLEALQKLTGLKWGFRPIE